MHVTFTFYFTFSTSRPKVVAVNPSSNQTMAKNRKRAQGCTYARVCVCVSSSEYLVAHMCEGSSQVLGNISFTELCYDGFLN